jgi:hypothetical protein
VGRRRPVYNITHLVTGFLKWTPNGMDRLDFATANYFIDPQHGERARVLDALSFEKRIDIGIGEARVGAEVNALDRTAIARQDRLQHALPPMGDALCRLPDGRGRDSRYLFADIFDPSRNCRRRRSSQQRNEFDFSRAPSKTAVEASTIEPSTVSAESPDTGRRLAVSAWACQIGRTGADLISLGDYQMAPKMSRSCVATTLPKLDNYQVWWDKWVADRLLGAR